MASDWSITEWSFTASRSNETAKPARPPSRWRIGLRVAALVLLFAGMAPIHLLTKLLFGRSPWPPRFLAAAGWICGARVSIAGQPVRPHSLLLANHSSWLDILILGGATGCAFVSKDNLGAGLIHWLADQNGTLYVSRSDRRGSKAQATAIARALESTQPVAIFPEGTTGPGDELLPFRSALLEAAVYAASDVEIRPTVVDYGDAATEVGWYGESGKSNVLRILGRKGSLPVTVRLLDPMDRSSDRKTIAREAQSAIAETLASTRRQPPLYAPAR